MGNTVGYYDNQLLWHTKSKQTRVGECVCVCVCVCVGGGGGVEASQYKDVLPA